MTKRKKLQGTSAKIFLKNKEDKFLFYLRENKPGLPFRNYWDLIGGHVEEAESELGALEREIQEEIGCLDRVREIERLGETYDYRYQFRIILFKGVIDSEAEINLREGQRFRYIPYQEIKGLRAPKFLKDFLYYAVSRDTL